MFEGMSGNRAELAIDLDAIKHRATLSMAIPDDAHICIPAAVSRLFLSSMNIHECTNTQHWERIQETYPAMAAVHACICDNKGATEVT